MEVYHKMFPEISQVKRLQGLEPPQKKVSMVLDTDPYNEIDDQFAMVYSLLSPERLDVKAVYAAPFANARSGDDERRGMEKSYEVAKEVLDRLRELALPTIPAVFRGSGRWVSEDDAGFKGVAIKSEAVEHLICLAETQPDDDPLYVVSIAAITNVASAILLKPEIIKKMVVVWLAGHPHNYYDTDEFNLRQDIYASRVILDCGVPLVLTPCFNVAEHLLLTVEDIENRIKGRGEIGNYLYKEYNQYIGEKKSISRPIWDITPIAWLVNPAWVETAIIPSPLLTVSPLQTGDYYTPFLTQKPDPRKNRRAHCTWNNDPRRHFIREAYRINRDAIFRDFYSRLDTYTKAEKTR
jgi:inosine-uridine nucleoside N-ribohydrolase